jgi:hypothetical protein
LRTIVEQVRAWVAATNPDTQALSPDVERQLIERQALERVKPGPLQGTSSL